MSFLAMEGSGPLADTILSSTISAWPGWLVEKIHAFFADFMMLLVGVHVLGVLVTSVLHRENLTLAMITGRKRGMPDPRSGYEHKPERGKES